MELVGGCIEAQLGDMMFWTRKGRAEGALGRLYVYSLQTDAVFLSLLFIWSSNQIS